MRCNILYIFYIPTEISEGSTAVYTHIYKYMTLLFHSQINLAIGFVLLYRYEYCFLILFH